MSLKTWDQYDESEWKRQPDERFRKNDERSPFERDRSRIIHSTAFRRLQGKTQVFGLGGSDFFRTRLTHSLEVAQIGKGIALRCKHADPDLVEAVCLAHDLGHPAFGHAGEIELQKRMAKHGGFNANAQNLRIVAQLEAKSEGYYGLNLTPATIDGLLKYKVSYSNFSSVLRRKRPHGFYYDTDRKLVKWACEGNKEPSFECDIMEWADNIAYSVHDLEDGMKAGMITQSLMDDSVFMSKVKQEFEADGSLLDTPDLEFVQQHIKEAYPDSGTEHYRKAKRKTIMAELINYFISNTSCKPNRATHLTRYQWLLDIPPYVGNRCRLLKTIVWEAIMVDERIATLERKAKTIVGTLFEEFTQWSRKDTRELFPPDFRERLDKAVSGQEKYRVACDYIAGMTDAHALRVYTRLREPESSSIFEIL